jgi:adenylate cyclase
MRHLPTPRYWFIAALLTLLFACLSGFIPSFDPLFSVHQRLEDLRWHWPRQQPERPPIVLVDIDEASLERVGTWPWPRNTTAALVGRLLDHYHVQLVGLDLLFPDPSYREQNDQLLATLMSREVVFAQSFGLDGGDIRTEKGLLNNALPCPPQQQWPQATGYVGLIRRLAQARAGHLTPAYDADGLIREYLPLIRYRTSCYPGLALAMYGQLAGSPLDRLQIRPPNGLSGSALLQDPQSGLSMPLTPRGSTPIAWHAGAWPSISAGAVLDGSAPTPLLDHAIVLIGSTATGLGDLVSTPLSPKFPGMQIHADVLASMIDQGWTYRTRWAWPITALITFLLSYGLFWLGRKRRPLALALVTLAASGIWTGVNALAWYHRLNLPWPPVLWITVLQLPVQLLVSSVQARTREQRIYHQFSRYLPKTVLDTLVESGADPSQLEAERREITVLFADLRDFTRLAEPLPPEQVAFILHLVMSRFGDIIGQHQGTLDKFIGDEVMAFWGAPLHVPDHADRALDCAHDMLAAVPDINRQLLAHGLPAVRIAIGINSGFAAVGNMGSHQRRAYTAVGDTVNLASRIEGLTRKLHEPVLMGEATCRLLRRHIMAPVDYVKIRGRERAILLAKPYFESLHAQQAMQQTEEAGEPVQGKLW